MIATNITQLENAIKERISQAASGIKNECEKIEKEELSDFYSQGVPNRYKRTYALENTGKSTDISTSGAGVSFDMYLDQTHEYTTGTWNMEQVMDAAESGAPGSGILGKPGFWDRATGRFDNAINEGLGKYFD